MLSKTEKEYYVISTDEKIEIKYLLQGTLVVSRPLGWDDYSLENKAEFAELVLSSADDATIVDGLRTTDFRSVELWEFPVEPQAIRDPLSDEVEYGIATPLWLNWAYASPEDSILHSITPRGKEQEGTIGNSIISRFKSWIGKITMRVVEFFKGIFNDSKRGDN